MADNTKVYSMLFSRVYPLLVQKVQRKGRTREELDSLTSWLTGYCDAEIESSLQGDITYGDFFLNAPKLNPCVETFKGTICGVKIELIEEPLMKSIRVLDKLADDLSKGKDVKKIIEKYSL